MRTLTVILVALLSLASAHGKTPGDEMEAALKWKAIPGVKKYVIQLSKDRYFGRVLLQRDVTAPEFTWLNPQKGQYWFRIAIKDDQGQMSPFSKPQVINLGYGKVGPEITSPANESEHEFRGKSPEIAVAWKSVTGAARYRVEAATSEEFERPEFSKDVAEQTLTINDLKPGLWHLKVTAVYPNGDLGPDSEPIAFTVSNTPMRLSKIEAGLFGSSLVSSRVGGGGQTGHYLVGAHGTYFFEWPESRWFVPGVRVILGGANFLGYRKEAAGVGDEPFVNAFVAGLGGSARLELGRVVDVSWLSGFANLDLNFISGNNFLAIAGSHTAGLQADMSFLPVTLGFQLGIHVDFWNFPSHRPLPVTASGNQVDPRTLKSTITGYGLWLGLVASLPGVF